MSELKTFESKDQVKIGMRVMLNMKSVYFPQCIDKANQKPAVGTIEESSRRNGWFVVKWEFQNRSIYVYPYEDLGPFVINDNEDALVLLKVI